MIAVKYQILQVHQYYKMLQTLLMKQLFFKKISNNHENNTLKFFLLPGMGADSTMYGSEFKKIDKLILINWPEYEYENSLANLAKKIIRLYQIQEGDIVGGSSLGGMIAAEISKYVKLKKIFLIGSSLISLKINPMLRHASGFVNIAPIYTIQKIAKNMAVFYNGHNKRVLEMFNKTNASFIKSMCLAVSKWEGCHIPQCRVFKIHGGKDKIIFPEKDSIIIENAGHMIAITHELQVVKFIKCNLK